MDEQLTNEPLTLTRNRKSMRPNPLADWELRVGDFRVLYNVVEDDNEVQVVAIGVKLRSKLFIDGEEAKL